MELEQAYTRGFCKVANAAGCDASELARYVLSKEAQASKILNILGGDLRPALGKFKNLLTGETVSEAQKVYDASRAALKKQVSKAVKGGKRVIDPHRYKGRNVRDMTVTESNYLEAKRRLHGAKENTLAARLGTGLAGTLGLAALTGDDKKPMYRGPSYPGLYVG